MSAARESVLTLHGVEADVDPVREEVERCGEEWDLPPGVLIEVQIALDEIISNIVVHGYGGREEREIEVRLQLNAEASELRIDIFDGAPPFSIFDVPPPDLSEELDEREIGGLGIHLVKSLMDDVQYSREEERNHVTLLKKIAEEEA